MTVYYKIFSSACLTCNFTFSGNWDNILHILWKSFRWSPVAILEAQIWNQAVRLEVPYFTSLGFSLITFKKYVFALQDYFAGVTVPVWCRVCWRWSSVCLEFSRASCWAPIPGLSSCHSSLPATISHCVDWVWGLSTFGWSEWCSHLVLGATHEFKCTGNMQPAMNTDTVAKENPSFLTKKQITGRTLLMPEVQLVDRQARPGQSPQLAVTSTMVQLNMGSKDAYEASQLTPWGLSRPMLSMNKAEAGSQSP